jgi:hypothetical protein
MRRADTHHKRGNRPPCAQVRIGSARGQPVRPRSASGPRTRTVSTCEHDDFAPLPVGYRSPVPGCRSAVPMLSAPGRRPYRGLR